MAGHNKWSKIKHKKAASDSQKSKIFGKMAQLIALESKKANGDRNSQSLRAAIDQAKSVNMPQQNIERAVERGTSSDAEKLETVTYEGYGPGGCAILVDALTDNRNRTAAEVRHIFTKYDFALGGPGSASWNFARTTDAVTPKTTIALSEHDKEVLGSFVSALLDQDDVQEVYTNDE